MRKLNRLSVRLLLLGLFGLLGLQALRLAALHRAVMRVRLLMVVAARTAEEEQNRLSVGTAHAASLRPWQVVVKRSTLAPQIAN
jgi:hypothetical protein